MKLLLAFLFLLPLCSCSTSAKRVPAGEPAGLNQEFHRESDQAFSTHERSLIGAAKKYLAQSNRRPKGASDDAYYRLRKLPEGYEVFVAYVKGYENKRPIFEPCFHNAVLLREDLTVFKVLVGPEALP